MRLKNSKHQIDMTQRDVMIFYSPRELMMQVTKFLGQKKERR